ncbi:Transcriptional regulator, AbiEi antitoxin, Type IV TA system [Pedococcus dokdonensis]|uniref:Transcriptional regulator, AbiEi antitoxin, Type IV TA system n=1 Tax=Pedococcus dokdonensis TaxID=443156 RepID=A0A1H0RG38_9MICO|nr:type IV toxin-antitoxin system AbiEi family antitoxin domain-containing protein [Pedococcus dokdonensis]SDP28149.1 Transcriptional regulator, AbiEi antitoxin, Type IV TA system [Pedococcus dokdonensis]
MGVDWRTLRQHADRQFDLLTRAQCLAAGMTDEAVQWRTSSGRWVRMRAGVFLTRPGREGWHVTATADLLRCQSAGPTADAAFCGRSALYLWGLDRRPPKVSEIVVPYERSIASGPTVRVRRSVRWEDLVDDTAYPWRTTLPATVLDVAAQGTAVDALATVARAVQKEVVSTGLLRAELASRQGHRHSRVLVPALTDVQDGAQSGAEVLYIRDVERAHGLPTATRQAPSDVGGRRFHDNEYVPYRLVVEVDGRLGHERWADRVKDGRRDRQLLSVDRATVRVFWVDVAATPCDTAVDIGAVLRARGWLGRPRPCRRHGCKVPRL